jgi:hypothetical protein
MAGTMPGSTQQWNVVDAVDNPMDRWTTHERLGW